MIRSVERKIATKQPAKNNDISRKHAYAEQRVIMAIDRYIAARSPANKEKARKWIHVWRAYRTSRR